MTNEVSECRLPQSYCSPPSTLQTGKENEYYRKGTPQLPYIGRAGPLADGLAHFGSDQLCEVAFYIVARFSNHGGSALRFSVTALMRP
jgi:hypothetical protein